MPDITLHIPGNKYDEFKKYFLMTHPNQTIDTTNPLSDDKWIKFRVLLFARGSYEKGFTQEYEALDGPVFDTNVITL